MDPELSIVVPIFDEEACLPGLLAELRATLAAVGRPYEIVCVDDGSRDGTPSLLEREAERDPAVRVLRFARNFGKEAALQAGIDAARGDAAVVLDADGQHPPSLIPTMIELWEQGYHVVDARKASRGDEGILYRVGARVFNLLVEGEGARLFDASDYKLLDRSAIDAIRALPERTRFFRGLVNWIGFRTATVEFDVPPRRAGRPGWTRLGLVGYALRNIASYSTLPLLLIAAVGTASTGLGAVLGAIALWDWATGAAVSGFTTVILMLMIFSGLILISLGVLSLYVSRLYEEVKGRPLYVMRPERKPGDEREAEASR